MAVTISNATLSNATAQYAYDSFWQNVSLLLPGNGTNGAQNNTFLDSSTNNFTITRNGNTTQGTFGPYGNNWSAFSDAFGDLIGFTGVVVGTDQFCIEMWFSPTGVFTTFGTLVGMTSQVAGRLRLRIPNATSIALVCEGAATYTFTVPTITVGKFYHLAVCRDSSNNTTVFLDGVRSSTGTQSVTNNFGECNVLGRYTSGTQDTFTGYLSNVRMVVGSSVYDPTQSTITVPASPLTAIANTQLLTLQSNRFVDNSGLGKTVSPASTSGAAPSIQNYGPFNNYASYSPGVYGGSGYFDGTGDYLSIADNAALQLTGDFTIEFWVYATVVPASRCRIFVKGNSAANDYNLDLNSTGTLTFGNNAGFTTSTGATTYNAWNHVAITRSGSASNNCTYWINGVASGNFTTTQSFNNTNELWIGQNQGGTPLAFTGYISNFRIVKGTAVYTASFTPPSSPLPTIANTSLLCNFTNAGIIDNAMMNDMETVGNAQISTAQSWWGGSSLLFDGTGDWLVMPNSPSQQFFTGNFTIEGWLRLNATGVAYGIVSKGTATTGWSVNVTSGDKLQFSYTATQLTGATSLVANQWYHFAVVRNGTGTGNLRIYLNGTADATSAGAVTDNFNQTNVQYVGADRVGGSSLNGYIDDLRITNGIARYTANFTPPTEPFSTS